MKSPDLQRLWSNDRAMNRQICNVKPDDVAMDRLNKLLAQFEIDYPSVILREERLCWFRYVSNNSVAQLRQFERCR